MAKKEKKVENIVKLQIPAGQANPSPPVGPALGQAGLNIMDFCNAFNSKTGDSEPGVLIPVVISVYSDKSFTFVTKSPPASTLLRKAAGINKGSGTPNTEKVGKVTRKQIDEIIEIKKEDLNAFDTEKKYDLEEAITILKDATNAKFEESIDVAINLGIDGKLSDQNVRGSAILPNGSGKNMRVVVFAEGEDAEAAKSAGADEVGMDDLAEKIKSGFSDFELVISTPSSMKIVGQLGQILGPKGVMPNPKDGTVTKNIKDAVNNAKKGQAMFRNDKGGIIHCSIGKLNFSEQAIKENFKSLIDEIKKNRPASAKGAFIKMITLSSTMGPGLKLKEN